MKAPQMNAGATWAVERHDQEDGSITYEVWNYDPSDYRFLTGFNERDYHKGNLSHTAKSDAELVAAALISAALHAGETGE